ncbi:MAG TPA: nucleotidyltransferase family protein [bacterium]|nr:nucleotidyltransferase family protein [bacterium]HQL61297.1 nucleotidyltransferase family protein [bacterium]
MPRQEIIDTLRAHQSELREQGVKSPALFGSVARNESQPDSDVDLLVEFDGPVGMFHFLRVCRHFSQLLQRKIGLVTRPALREEMREGILREAVDVTWDSAIESF